MFSERTVSRDDFAHLPPLVLEIEDADGDLTEQEFFDYPEMARQYAEMIISGAVPACRYTILACKRYARMLDEAEKPGNRFYFSKEWVVDACSFIENLARPDSEPPDDIRFFVIQPCQAFWLANLFGFRRGPGFSPIEQGERLFREIYLEVPRGSGKSPFAGAISMFCYLEEGAGGSQIFVCGPKEDQARYVFDPMTVMAEHSPGLKDHYGLIVTKKGIRKAANENSKVRMISSIADREDGANPHVVVMEELHAQDEALFNVMDSSLGKRPNNLFLSITTAGNRATGVCYNTRRRLIQILEGVTDDDSFFGVIYTLDDHEIKDKKIAHDPARWIKANPMWGITLVPSSLMERYTKAKAQSPAAVLEFERTRLNIWSNGAGGLVDPDNWNNCFNAELKRSDLKGKTCWVGADLASKNDITAVGIMFNERGRVQIFNRYYVPELSAAFKHSEVGPLYQGWVESGHLITTAGAITDYNAIDLDIREWAQEHEMVVAVFDRYQSNHILTNLYNDGIPAMDMSSGIQTISDPAKDFFALIEGGILEHDGHPVTTWMAMNVVGYIDSRENLLPKKEDPNSPFKIDGIAALIAANTARLDKQLNVDTKKTDVYEQRGLIGADDD